jgi:hypothetical protein
MVVTLVRLGDRRFSKTDHFGPALNAAGADPDLGSVLELIADRYRHLPR